MILGNCDTTLNKVASCLCLLLCDISVMCALVFCHICAMILLGFLMWSSDMTVPNQEHITTFSGPHLKEYDENCEWHQPAKIHAKFIQKELCCPCIPLVIQDRLQAKHRVQAKQITNMDVVDIHGVAKNGQKCKRDCHKIQKNGKNIATFTNHTMEDWTTWKGEDEDKTITTHWNPSHASWEQFPGNDASTCTARSPKTAKGAAFCCHRTTIGWRSPILGGPAACGMLSA